MGYKSYSDDAYRSAQMSFGVSRDCRNVTFAAEVEARKTNTLRDTVNPAVSPMRYSKIRLDPHQGKWIVTVGMPMDIEMTCDTTGSMGSEVDTVMATLPLLHSAISRVAPEYDLQLALGIFGDCGDAFVGCRPQFEMLAEKIVEYLKDMAPCRGGCGNHGEDPQYMMFARAYLTRAYTEMIGMKGYHFVVTNEPYHNHLKQSEIKRIFGDDIFQTELKGMEYEMPSVKEMVRVLKQKTHQFVLVLENTPYFDTVSMWKELCGDRSVITIRSTSQLPIVIPAIIGLTEGSINVSDLNSYLNDSKLTMQLSRIDIGAQAALRQKMAHPMPKAGDIFINKEDTWPIQNDESKSPIIAASPVQGSSITWL